MDEKCVEYREYLRVSGVVAKLTEVLNKLYELENRPKNPLDYLCKNLNPKDNESIITLEKELSAAKLNIQLLKNEKSLNAGAHDSIESAIERLKKDETCDSLLKKNLTKDLFNELATNKTQTSQATIFDCIKAGLIDYRQDIGLFAADADCYSTFSKLFQPIVLDYHSRSGVRKDPEQPSWDGDVDELHNIDPEGKYIQRGVITCHRTLQEFPMQMKMTKTNYSDIKYQITNAVISTISQEEFKGHFYGFEAENSAIRENDKLIFNEHSFDELSIILGATDHWPTGRAAYISNDKTFVVWINHRDHLEFKSIQNDHDVKKLYKRIVAIGKMFDEKMKFINSNDYGWLTCSPKNIGNAMKVSIFIKLDKLPANESKFKELLEKNSLIVGDGDGETTEHGNMVYEIQNKSSLGLTQFNTMKEVLQGIEEIIAAEKQN